MGLEPSLQVGHRTEYQRQIDFIEALPYQHNAAGAAIPKMDPLGGGDFAECYLRVLHAALAAPGGLAVPDVHTSA